MYNPATSRGDVGVSTLRSTLVIVHGVLMLVAWPLLSFVAIFFAAWMKPALPNGQWFQVMCYLSTASLQWLVGICPWLTGGNGGCCISSEGNCSMVFLTLLGLPPDTYICCY